jgi:hypothetical protein
MLMVAGALLLQFSSFVARDLPYTQPAVPPAEVASAKPSESTCQANVSSLKDIKLTNLSFDTEKSASLKTVSLDRDSSPNTASLSTIHVPENPTRPEGVKTAESYPRRAWFLLAVAQHGAAAFDAYSTRYAVGHGAVEKDPLMRPFAHSPSIYAVSQVSPTVLDLVSRRMLRSEKGFIRYMWWLPQSMSAGVYIFAGVHNFGVSNSR